MKNYLQSIGYLIFLVISFIGLMTAFTSYENPFNMYENPLLWTALISFILVIIFREVLNIVLRQKAEELQLEKDGIDPSTIDRNEWYKKLMKKWTKSKAIEEENEIILDHNYDGIKELDNSLPPWWVYMFYATILFAAVYLVRYHVLDGDDQATEYSKAVAEAQAELDKYKKATPNDFDINNVTLLTDASDLKRGKAIFSLNCTSCHANDGGGGIGPNLTDKNWILGGSFKNVFTSIYEGGRPGKGMVPWGKTLKGIDVQKVASYVLSLQGTTPAAPKQAEGDFWEEE